MNKKRTKFNVLNFFIILITVVYFIVVYTDIVGIFKGESFFSILVMIVTVAFVHAVKFGRLYIVLYGSDIQFKTYLKIYCKVTPVSVVLPFKIGEFFRMYCHGKQLGNVLKGIIIILLDRFMDTIALVTTILLVWAFSRGHLISFLYVLLIFLIIIMLIYFVFPGLFQFWKKYLLRAKASPNKMVALKVLETLNLIYLEIENVVKGRGVILYCLSLIAWGAEIGSLALRNGILNNNERAQIISNYLLSAMGGRQSPEMSRCVFITVVMLIFLYAILKSYETIWGKKGVK